jgi:FAD/FMN-containing dehydrogenase/Fe-S oxidoreductase
LDNKDIQELKKRFSGEIKSDPASRIIYATDASAYREIPQFVCYPKNKEDIKHLIAFAKKHRTTITPRTAGTSLAGQVVGNGIIADVSKHMKDIIQLNINEKWVKVQAGVVLDELNMYLKPQGLFFGPEASTANRCMIAGMLGNNACGLHSPVYGSTRDHTLEVEAILSDGSEAVFGALDIEHFNEKLKLDNLEGRIYQDFYSMLSSEENRTEINKQYPDKEISRRNTAYALDLLLDSVVFSSSNKKFNFSNLLAGSEGTLAFTTSVKLNLVEIPPKYKALICVHHNSIEEALYANILIRKHKPRAIELMDKTIMDLTKKNMALEKNRFFLEGDPAAILIVEMAENESDTLTAKADALIAELKKENFGYAFPIVYKKDINKVWDLRKAGLGVLSNMPGDAKPVSVVEDTAINPEKLPQYIAEFNKILKKYSCDCVYHAHIATGELHLRPILNLKLKKDVETFHHLAEDTAKLVKKYNGSLSGEHGDGRLRGEFIPIMYGDKVYKLLEQSKQIWDAEGVFNKGKITATPPMNTQLRYEPGKETKIINTIFDFSSDQGYLRAAEKCNGTAACRKTEIIGGTMCPSFMASRNEYQTTRARANVLREFITNSNKKNPFDHRQIYEIMDLCLSCKACKSECPSSVDITKLKAEFLQHYYDDNGIGIRTRLIANITHLNQLGSYLPSVYNFLINNSFSSKLMASVLGFSKERKFPKLSKMTLDKWAKKRESNNAHFPNGKLYLFNDEFTRFNDANIGIKAIMLLEKLGYEVVIPKHIQSGRTYLSKGMLRKAKKIAIRNIGLLKDKITAETPLIGIEPSAILAFRDEYPDLVGDKLKPEALRIKPYCLLIDEFLEREMKAGKINKRQFTKQPNNIKLHGHCHQKSLASTSSSLFVLGFPENYHVEEIPSGCCGMAGAFGYEKEHYDLSMQVGELVLFPAIRTADTKTIIAAAGTSCRQQIKDGTKRDALHPIEVLWEALDI